MSEDSFLARRLAFPWLEKRRDAQQLDGWWLPCLHHLFRDILLYHAVDSPLHVLFRPMHLVFFVDKNRYPWIWDGAAENFAQPRFNRGVVAHWCSPDMFGQTDPLEVACHQIHMCLESGRIPLIYLEWSLVPFTTHFKRLRGNLHAVGVLDYQPDEGRLYMLDRTALPASRGGFEKDRGWVQKDVLRPAVEAEFGWLDYQIGKPTLSWETERQMLLRESVAFTRQGRRFATPNSDHGLNALSGFSHFIKTLEQDELATTHLSSILRWHLSPCIRKYVIGQRRMLDLILEELAEPYPEFVAQARIPLRESMHLWETIAALLVRLGFEKESAYQLQIEEHIQLLIEKESKLCDGLERLASAS